MSANTVRPVITSERAFRALVDALAHFVWRCDSSGKLIDISDDWLELVGRERADVLGSGWLDAVDPQDRAEHEQAWRTAVAEKAPFERETLLRTSDGSVRHFLARSAPVRDADGRLVEWVGAGIDVSDLRQYEQESERQKEQYRNLVESTSAILWEAEPETFRFTYVSPEAGPLTGFPPDEWLADPDFWVNHLHPDDRGWAKRKSQELSGVGQRCTFDYRFITAGGEAVWLRDVETLVETEDGQQRLVGVMVDITPLKHAEAQREYVAGLQRTLVEISRDLVGVDTTDLEASIQAALERVGTYCGVDRSYLFRFSEDCSVHRCTHEWCAEGIEPQLNLLAEVPSSDLPNLVAAILRGEVVHVADTARLAEAWGVESEFFQGHGIHSLVVVPLFVGERIAGQVGFDVVARSRSWADEEIQLLRGLADVIGTAIERDRVERAMRATEVQIRAVTENMPGNVYQRILSPTGELSIGYIGPGFKRVFRIDSERVMRDADYLLECLHPDDRDAYVESVHASARNLTPHDVEFRLLGDDGEYRWSRSISRPHQLDDGTVVWDGIAIDETERKRAEQEAEDLSRRLANTLERITDAFFVVDRDWCFTYINQQAERLLKRSRDELLGRDYWQQFPEACNTPIERGYRRALNEGCAVHLEEFYSPLGMWLEIHAYPSEDGLAVYFRDVTERKRANEEIEFLALYDPLTRLPNRRLLLDRLQQALSGHQRGRYNVALLFLDLDNFKNLNDTLGHVYGDRLLQQVARRLAACVRDSDTVARFGGDEFAIVLGNLDVDEVQATRMATEVGHKILQAVAQPYHLDEHQRYLTASIGVTLFDAADDSSDDLMKRVDLAMYQAKDAGRGTVRVFDPQMRTAIHSRVSLEADLREALHADTIVPHFLPQVAAGRGIVGAEALARWVHAERGVVPPGQFIPVAEESDLILVLGERMLEQVCMQLATWSWNDATAHLEIAVNVSARQFHHPEFQATVRSVLARTGAPAHRLCLELTESMLLSSVDDTIARMDQLKQLGVRFALDDFGTGYSSLAYLKQLPLDDLKIDQAFVRDALIDSNDAAIIRTIVALAGAMGLGVVAEGVETEAVRAMLEAEGCNRWQGFLFSQPVPAQELEALFPLMNGQAPAQ